MINYGMFSLRPHMISFVKWLTKPIKNILLEHLKTLTLILIPICNEIGGQFTFS